ncbi:hypothetical protein [Candidatus Competibacter phosphatis]|jgi:hypothetical protein|uniref:hypothetical protein n=1 Tax=Candidatus Competibacter phosphatis TaxID=221280 RepID=UPI00145F4280|nr:hypothetical protein [Candidatus Competibacter phosphatis]
MSDRKHEMLPGELPESVREERRDFLISLGRWSKAVIGGVLLGGLLVPGRDAEAGDWGNRGGGRGGSWINFGGGWGWGPQPWGWGWYNRPWYNRPWYNRPWYNRPWYNRPWYNGPRWGGGWYNR